MANIISKGLGMVNDFTSNETISTLLTSEANKAWRAKILLDRITRPGPKDHPSKVMPNTELQPKYEKSSKGQLYMPLKKSKSVSANKLWSQDREKSSNRDFEITFSTNDGTQKVRRNAIMYPRESAKEPGNQIIIYNWSTSPVSYVILQTIPTEIDFQNESSWAIINSMGRNTPMYHFTGAESVIQMNISWFCNDRSNPQEVVTKCRLLEAWTKANGYKASPPILKLQWGRSQLFEDQFFILTAATFKLSNWRAEAKVWDYKAKKYVMPQGYVDPAMYPGTATQELIFRRVSTTNLTYEDIVPNSWIEKTNGIGKQKTKT